MVETSTHTTALRATTFLWGCKMFSRSLKVAAVLSLLAVSATAIAGRVGGSGIVTERVEAYDADTYYIDFYGNEWAEVSVTGDGDTDVDVFVYDMNGTLVAQDIGYTDRCFVDWYPRRRGTYRIVVRNLGSVWNRYTLRTN